MFLEAILLKVCVCAQELVLTAFWLFVLWFVMGYVLQFEELEHERMHYYIFTVPVLLCPIILVWFKSSILFWFDSNHSLIVITVTNQSYNCYCYHQFPGNGDRCDFCVGVCVCFVCFFDLKELQFKWTRCTDVIISISQLPDVYAVTVITSCVVLYQLSWRDCCNISWRCLCFKCKLCQFNTCDIVQFCHATCT